MRIVFLAVDDEFAGEMQRFIYETCPDWIVGSVISSSMIYKKSAAATALFVMKQSGIVFLAEMIRMKIVRRFLDRKDIVLPGQLARRHGTEVFISSDINAHDSLEKLRSWKPDLIISTNFSHYIGKTARESIAAFGCWNLHKSLLPAYRGMAPSFHALLEGADNVGATLHVVARGFDTGDVLAQVSVPVTAHDSVYCLNRKTSRAGGQLLASFLKQYDPVLNRATPQPAGSWPTYTYPTHAQIRTFRRRGLRFYRQA